MNRLARMLLAALVLGSLMGRAPADQPPALREVLLLQEAMQAAIADAEPSIACILVSRSDVYRRWYGQSPGDESSGQLGGFDPGSAHLNYPREDQLQVKELEEKIGKRFENRASLEAIRKEFDKQFDLGDTNYVPESFGSGVVIDEKGLILTNYHVIRDATKIYVRLPSEKGCYADIHAADPRSDLAVLRLRNPLTVRPIKFGDGGKARKGQWILSLAHPFAAGFRDGSPSASWGIVSNIRRRPASNMTSEFDRSKPLYHYGTLLQIDARLNLGCSGGALINLQGEMIGLTNALAALTGSETAGGFAMPLDAGMQRIINILKQGLEVEYGFLGVRLDSAAATGKGVNIGNNGVRISNIIGGSPAARANLEPNSVITAINGQRLRENDDLLLAVGTMLAGSEVNVEFEAGLSGRTKRTVVKLTKFAVPGKIIASQRPVLRGLRVDYTSLLAQHVIQNIPDGVLICEIKSGSLAEKAGLRLNEIITHVNGLPVNTPEDFYREGNKLGPLELTLASSDQSKPSPTITLPAK